MGTTPHTTFVIRIWWTDATPLPAPPATRRWYGHVEHLESGRKVAFSDLAALLAFIQKHSGLRAPAEE